MLRHGRVHNTWNTRLVSHVLIGDMIAVQYLVASSDKLSHRRPLVHIEGKSSITTFQNTWWTNEEIKDETMEVDRTMTEKPRIATYT